MATQLADKGTHWEVSTVSAAGEQHKLPRGRVKVPYGQPDVLRAEILRQAKAARIAFDVKQDEEAPVV